MEVSFAIALLAGMGSFFSPCIFPLLPVYFSVLSGVSVQDLGRAEVKRVFLSALMFVLGFTAVFMALGASFGSIGYLLLRWRPVLQVVGGGVVAVLPLHLLGVRFLPFLFRERRMEVGVSIPLIGPFLIGAAFAFGWSPCVGPILGSILTYAMTGQDPRRGMLLLGVYSLGLAVPFLLISLAWNRFISLFGKLKRGIRWVNLGSGAVLLGVGVWLIMKGVGL